jgi:adenylate kinase
MVMGRKVVILLGHPGVGKGTQAKEIMRELNIPQISTGDMLRDAIVSRTPHGLTAKGEMDSGRLVSDHIVNGIVADRILREDCESGFILDGYPRNVRQAETFRSQMKADDSLFVIEIGADSSNLVNRLLGRLMCPACGNIYNIYSRAPKSVGICDQCSAELIHRSDDQEDLIMERFRTYREETYPLMEFYQKLGVFRGVDGMRPILDVKKDILEILDCEVALTRTPTKRGNQKFA